MTILIPVNSKNRDECLISSIEENKAWAFVSLEEGRVLSVEFFDRREDINSWIDAVVVINELEYVWPFMDEGIIALIAPTQKSIDEIVEAFLFKDLHDFSI
jgi:predicted Fe-Mo cluster-binding NifX family protein